MDLRIDKVTFSNPLLMSLSPRHATVIPSQSSGNYELRIIPDVVGEINAICYFHTNMGVLEYEVVSSYLNIISRLK